jgi:hypothetical protein
VRGGGPHCGVELGGDRLEVSQATGEHPRDARNVPCVEPAGCLGCVEQSLGFLDLPSELASGHPNGA